MDMASVEDNYIRETFLYSSHTTGHRQQEEEEEEAGDYI